MMRRLGIGAFALGLAVLVWVAWGYAGHSPLALAMIGLIGAVYAAGARELWLFHQASGGLRAALADLPGMPVALADLPGMPAALADLPGMPAALADQPAVPEAITGWLARLPAALRAPVRLRIEGQRVALPGPALAPYLVGLLVLLGMLGTFLGMVVTLKGAVLALEITTDLPTLRAALAAPVRGLGLAFGSSVAGVAASAMLGLLSALCRQERQHLSQALDNAIAAGLQGPSPAQWRAQLRAQAQADVQTRQRQAMLDALQAQAGLLPAVVDQLQAVAARLDSQHLTLAQRLDSQHLALAERLAQGQDHFHQQAVAAYSGLAAAVGSSLQQGLIDAAHRAESLLAPLVQASLGSLARDSAAFQQQVLADAQARLDTATAGFAQHSSTLLAAVDAGQAARQADVAAAQASWLDRLGRQAAALLGDLAQAQALQQRAADQGLRQAWQQAAAQAADQQQQWLHSLAQTGQRLQEESAAQARSLMAEVARLVDAAAQAPQAAADVVGQLRQQLSDSLARDTGLQQERSQIVATLGTLLDAVGQAASGQHMAITTLVDGSTALLARAEARLAEAAESQRRQLDALVVQIGDSAVDVASLGESFGAAVQQFSASSGALLQQLQRIEAALGQSSARSDEQLAYYVAQAREVIDLSLSSQQQIVSDLQRLARRPSAPADPGA